MSALSSDGAVVVIVLAAGRGARFHASGGVPHKLDARLDDRSVLAHVLRSVEAAGLPHHLVRPAGGTDGIGSSIALGVAATAGARGWLILPGDLPLIQPDTLKRVVTALDAHAVVVPHCQGQAGHPVGFARACFDALARLSGDTGAAGIVRAWRARGAVLDLPCDDVGVVLDVDTVDDLRAAAHRLGLPGIAPTSPLPEERY